MTRSFTKRYNVNITKYSEEFKTLGKLYEKDGIYSKMDLSYDDVTNLSELLRRDKKRDIDYAVKDAQILVNHLRAMEVFNRGVKSRGFHCLPWVELLSPMNE
jgi:hypothetical protein